MKIKYHNRQISYDYSIRMGYRAKLHKFIAFVLDSLFICHIIILICSILSTLQFTHFSIYLICSSRYYFNINSTLVFLLYSLHILYQLFVYLCFVIYLCTYACFLFVVSFLFFAFICMLSMSIIASCHPQALLSICHSCWLILSVCLKLFYKCFSLF